VALVAVAGDEDGLSGISALQDSFRSIESEATFLLFGAVTAEAVILEDWFYVLLEINLGCGGSIEQAGRKQREAPTEEDWGFEGADHGLNKQALWLGFERLVLVSVPDAVDARKI
jgi:hypothetical protein